MTELEDVLKSKLIKMSKRCICYHNGDCLSTKLDYFIDGKYVRKQCNPLDCYADYEVTRS